MRALESLELEDCHNCRCEGYHSRKCKGEGHCHANLMLKSTGQDAIYFSLEVLASEGNSIEGLFCDWLPINKDLLRVYHRASEASITGVSLHATGEEWGAPPTSTFRLRYKRI